jgi:hypothetical protein
MIGGRPTGLRAGLKSSRELTCRCHKIDEWGLYIGERMNRPFIKKAGAGGSGFQNGYVFSEIEGQFGKHSETVISRLDGIECSTGFAVTPGTLGSAPGNGQIRMDVKYIIDS